MSERIRCHCVKCSERNACRELEPLVSGTTRRTPQTPRPVQAPGCSVPMLVDTLVPTGFFAEQRSAKLQLWNEGTSRAAYSSSRIPSAVRQHTDRAPQLA